MNLKRSLMTGAAGAALMAATAIAPFAAGAVDKVDQINENTGYKSHNYNRFRLRRKVQENVTNIGTAVNTANVVADTGDNDQNKNTTAGDQKSGAITTKGIVVNDLNSSIGEGSDLPEPTEVDVNQTNEDTGPRSRNKNSVSIRDRFERNLTNSATAINTVDVDANTGGNDQNKNTDGGNQTSGNVSTTFDFTNFLNYSE